MATCYYPNGTVWESGWPCWDTKSADDYAPCCSKQGYCYSNGYCMSGSDMSVYRGGCTDQNWQSDSCRKKCLGGQIGGIYNCGGGKAGCYASDCGTEYEFGMTSGSLLLAGPAATSVVKAAGYTLSSDATAAGITSTVTATAPPDSKNANNFSSGALAGVGVGVGIPLLIAFLTVLFMLLKERKKNKQLLQQQAVSVKSQSHDWSAGDKSEMEVRAYQSGHGQGTHQYSLLNTSHEIGGEPRARSELAP